MQAQFPRPVACVRARLVLWLLAAAMGMASSITQAASSPQVVQVLASCAAGTITVSYNEPVQLDGVYTLDQGAAVLGRNYGANAAEVVLNISPLSLDGLYQLTISNVHSADASALVVAPNPTRWGVACADKLVASRDAGNQVNLGWRDPTAVLQTSADLRSWSDVAYALSPYAVPPSLLPRQFYRLRLPQGTNSAATPVITSQPGSVGVGVGDSVQFSAAAAGAGLLSYQWLFNGALLPGATGQVLAVTGVGEGQVGEYRLAVTNAFGAAISQPAYLTISNDTGGLAFNTALVQTTVSALLLSSQVPADFPFNTTMAQPSVSSLLLSSQAPPDYPFNTTVAQPAVSALLLSSQQPPDYPFNTTVAQPSVSALLLSSQAPPDYSFNTTLAQPQVRALLPGN